jgi:hypothetical protein
MNTPFRAMCFNAGHIPGCGNRFNHLLKEGKEYTVIEVLTGTSMQTLRPCRVYVLSEIQIPIRGGFSDQRFVPLSDLPTEDQEKEIECENEAIIYQR